MFLATTESVPGTNVQTIGLVMGSTVQSKHMGKDIMAGLKGMVGGELTGYTEMLNDARNIATQRMIEHAQSLGADGILAIRYSSAGIVDGAAEVLAYGTAVKFL